MAGRLSPLVLVSLLSLFLSLSPLWVEGAAKPPSLPVPINLAQATILRAISVKLGPTDPGVFASWNVANNCTTDAKLAYGTTWAGIRCDALGSVIAIGLSRAKIASGKFSAPPAWTAAAADNFYTDDYGNILEGFISADIGKLTTLMYIVIEGHSLSRSIPSTISSLTNLLTLDLSDNILDGPIPDEIGNLLSLTYLSVANNQFLDSDSVIQSAVGGVLPNSLSSLTKLTIIELQSCNFEGAVPSLKGLTALLSINLEGNQFEGALTDFLSSANSKLSIINVGSNKFSGFAPFIATLPGLKYLKLENNKFSGAINTYVGPANAKLGSFIAGVNRMTGPLPAFDKTFKVLTEVRLADGLTRAGPIPATWGELPKLSILDLSSIGLTGPLPAGFGSGNKLAEVYLSSNSLTIDFIGGLTSITLKILRCDSCNLKGSLLSFSKLKVLDTLGLSNNALSGPLPSILTTTGSTISTLDFSDNSFSGTIPETWAWKKLKSLDLSKNKLTGPIPLTFKSITTLSLESNTFYGKLPVGFAPIFLNVKDNQLSGVISVVYTEDLSLTLDGNFFSSVTVLRPKKSDPLDYPPDVLYGAVTAGENCIFTPLYDFGDQKSNTTCRTMCDSGLPAGACGLFGSCGPDGSGSFQCTCNLLKSWFNGVTCVKGKAPKPPPSPKSPPPPKKT